MRKKEQIRKISSPPSPLFVFSSLFSYIFFSSFLLSSFSYLFLLSSPLLFSSYISVSSITFSSLFLSSLVFFSLFSYLCLLSPFYFFLFSFLLFPQTQVHCSIEPGVVVIASKGDITEYYLYLICSLVIVLTIAVN